MNFTGSQIDELNDQLRRVGAADQLLSGLNFSDNDGVASFADDGSYYELTKDFAECLSTLSALDDNEITDPLYDGEDRALWKLIWGLA